MSQQLAEKWALVTGAGSGIGREIAHSFGEEGANVVLADVDADGIAETASDLDGDTLEVVCDVRDAAEVDAEIGSVFDEIGGVDVVVNNAGIITRKELVETTETEIRDMIDTNLTGAIHVARATIPGLRAGGSLINMSSIASIEGLANRSVYSATKGGLSSLTYQLAVELAPDVRVNAIAPGTIDTSLNRGAHQDEELVETKMSMIPLQRFGTPEDIADAAVFLASDSASYVTGHVLFVDGGRSIS